MENNLKIWFENYKKYIQMQKECLIHAYEYGGMKFSKWQFPSFKEFSKKLGTKYDYTQYFIAEEYDLNHKKTNYYNTLNYCFRPDINDYKIKYSFFNDIKWNKNFEFSEKYNHILYKGEKEKIINKYGN